LTFADAVRHERTAIGRRNGGTRTTSVPSVRRTSTQVLLPPYRTVNGPGVGIEPQTPKKVTRTAPSLNRVDGARQDHGDDDQ
jgi:hypothetical protein